MAHSVKAVPKQVLDEVTTLLSRGVTSAQVARQMGMSEMKVCAIKKEWMATLSSKKRAVVEARLKEGKAKAVAGNRHKNTPKKIETAIATEVVDPAQAQPRKRIKRSQREKYRQAIRKKIKIGDRADILIKLAKGSHAQVAMRALEHIDEIDGITEAEKGGVPPSLGPIFLFPPGASIDMRPVSQLQKQVVEQVVDVESEEAEDAHSVDA